MRKILLGIGGLVVLFFVGKAVWRGLASDETKIRWLIEDTVEAYNAGRAGSTVACLAEDWKDGNSGLDRDTLRLILARTFLTERDPKTRELLVRVAVDEPTISIEFDPADEDRASASGTARFSRLSRDAWTESWVVHMEGELRRIDGDWKVVGTERLSKQGKRP